MQKSNLSNKVDEKYFFEDDMLLIKKTFDVVELVLPYITYYVMRYQQQDKMDLPELVSNYFNQILASQ